MAGDEVLMGHASAWDQSTPNSRGRGRCSRPTRFSRGWRRSRPRSRARASSTRPTYRACRAFRRGSSTTVCKAIARPRKGTTIPTGTLSSATSTNRVRAALKRRLPVVSVDTKKKELVTGDHYEYGLEAVGRRNGEFEVDGFVFEARILGERPELRSIRVSGCRRQPSRRRRPGTCGRGPVRRSGGCGRGRGAPIHSTSATW